MNHRAYYAAVALLSIVLGIMLFLHFGGRIDGANIVWPPAYYTLRDRVPFMLTLIYVYRGVVPARHRRILGLGLTAISGGVALLAFLLYVDGYDMTAISTIGWSAPSPIEWGLFIVVSTVMLWRRGLNYFTGFYLSFLAALGGGWLYETPNWVHSGNWDAFFKINSAKVFFVDFQLLCLPILIYIVATTKRYQINKMLVPLALLFLAWCWWQPEIKPIFYSYHHLFPQAFKWVVRLPTIFMLSAGLYGVKGEKNSG